MKRQGLYKPTIEDAIEIGGVETLHPGGFALTKRTAELAKLKKGMKILDVSSGRGTQSIYYAKNYDVEVIGLDISTDMINTSTENAKFEGINKKGEFQQGDSQKVLDEMLRVVKKGGKVLIHESIWKQKFLKMKKKKYLKDTEPLH
jgi:ubiquinone/menaquinone biosynthesis C-methylase UbiE